MGVRRIADILGLSHTTISQWQNGTRVPSSENVAALLAVLRVTGDRREDIMDLARASTDPNWLAPRSAVRLRPIHELERAATEVIAWAPLLISGLLQTEEYARAIVDCDRTAKPDEITTRVQLRTARLAALTRDRNPPANVVILLGESAFGQVFGGHDVMITQLYRIIEEIKGSTTTTRIVPFGTGWHPGLNGPFLMYNFDQMPSIVFRESYRRSTFLYDKDDVADYQDAAVEVRSLALSQHESAAFVANIVRRFETA